MKNLKEKSIPSLHSLQAMIIFGVDDHEIMLHNMKAEDVEIPSFGKCCKRFVHDNERMHIIKKSRFIRLKSQKTKGEEHFYFYTRNKPDKKSKTGKVKEENVLKPQKYDYQKFFYNLILHAIIKRIDKYGPRIKKVALDGSTNLLVDEIAKLIETEFPPSDQRFMKQLIKTQIFNYFFENHL